MMRENDEGVAPQEIITVKLDERIQGIKIGAEDSW
jgi:hypothetical protein